MIIFLTLAVVFFGSFALCKYLDNRATKSLDKEIALSRDEKDLALIKRILFIARYQYESWEYSSSSITWKTYYDGLEYEVYPSDGYLTARAVIITPPYRLTSEESYYLDDSIKRIANFRKEQKELSNLKDQKEIRDAYKDNYKDILLND